MNPLTTEETSVLLENAKKRWEERSHFSTPIVIPQSLEDQIRTSSPGPGGFPEGHLYLARVKQNEGEPQIYVALRYRCGDENSNKVIRVGNYDKNILVIPYAVLRFRPGDDFVSDFVFYSKFCSTSLHWIDQLMLFLPSKIKLFIEDAGDIDDKKMKDISHLVRTDSGSNRIDGNLLQAVSQPIDRFIMTEMVNRGNLFDLWIEKSIEAMGQPPLFSYLFSTHFTLK